MKKLIMVGIMALAILIAQPPISCNSESNNTVLTSLPTSLYNHSGKKALTPSEAKTVAVHVIDRLPHIEDKLNYKKLVQETASAETDFGEFKLRPKIKGMYQIHIQSAKEILDVCKKVHPEGYQAVMAFYDYGRSFAHNLHHNILFGTAVCATYYKFRMSKSADISTVRQRGLQWLKVYATSKGGGSMPYWLKKSKQTETVS